MGSMDSYCCLLRFASAPQLRILVLQRLNNLIVDVLPLIDMRLDLEWKTGVDSLSLLLDATFSISLCRFEHFLCVRV